MRIREDQHGFKEGHCITTHVLLLHINCTAVGFRFSLTCGHELRFDILWIVGLAGKFRHEFLLSLYTYYSNLLTPEP
jgi:hypothetical protein